MKKIKVLLLSMLLGGAILADPSALTVNAEGSSATTTGSVVIEDGGFSFKTSDKESFSFLPKEGFTFQQREIGLNLTSEDSFTIDFVDDRYNSDGYSIIATIDWNTDEKEFKLIGAEVILDSKTASIKTSKTNEMDAPIVNDVKLVNDMPTEVIKAVRTESGFEGAGPWAITFENPQLVIKPNTLSPGTHSATINWTLGNSPQE